MAAIGYDAVGTHKVDASPQIVKFQAETGGNFTMREAAPAPDAGSIIDRLRELFGVRTDGDLATELGLGATALSNWRSRNAPPFPLCVKVAQDRGVSLDWLVFGRGDRNAAVQGIGSTTLQNAPAARISQFVKSWDESRPADELVWLEQQLKRAVPEFAEWLARDQDDHTRT